MSPNPTPRPALRKAPDATIHPAAPVADDSLAPVVDPKVAKKVVKDSQQRPAHLRPVVGLGGSTSDVLRRAPETEEKKRDKGKSKGKAGKKRAKKAAKVHQRRVDLKVKVPKDVRQALRSNAKARGTSVDDVVTNVLQGWLHG
jgi:hypothetical protein